MYEYTKCTSHLCWAWFDCTFCVAGIKGQVGIGKQFENSVEGRNRGIGIPLFNRGSLGEYLGVWVYDTPRLPGLPINTIWASLVDCASPISTSFHWRSRFSCNVLNFFSVHFFSFFILFFPGPGSYSTAAGRGTSGNQLFANIGQFFSITSSNRRTHTCSVLLFYFSTIPSLSLFCTKKQIWNIFFACLLIREQR